MENQFFLNAGVNIPLHFEPFPAASSSSTSSSMLTWQSLSSAMDSQPMVLNCSSEKTQDCFYNPTWGNKSTDHALLHFDSSSSALSSMVSSPAASNSNNVPGENFIIRELIGKLGNIAEISPSSYINGNNNSTNTSCYSTPLSSPLKLNIPKVVKSMAMNSSVAEFSSDPGFTERAAKFSCFGSRSFNGSTSQLGMNCNAELTQRSTPLMENEKLSRVSSSPSLKAVGSQMGTHENKNSPLMEMANSQEESTVSQPNPNGDTGFKPAPYVNNSRKRKASFKGKAKETSKTSTNPLMANEANGDSNAKRSKPNENGGNENGTVKTEEESKGGTSNAVEDENQNKSNSKSPESPKDYIHVRARRGQATDSHSLAERVRREKISERMRLLQDLVPGCNKVTGKALMLDEIINYVQSLQRQVEFLSMKLASVNTRLDFSIESLISKDVFQSNNSMALAHPIFPLDSSAPTFYGHQQQQNPAIHNDNITNGTVTHTSVNHPLDNLAIQLPWQNGFNETGSQYPMTFSEGDLHTIVQMGIGQTANRKTPIESQGFKGTNQVPL